jgi:hypothetical protein
MTENKSYTIDKDFILSDSSLNVYGFRLLTSGYRIDEYRKNPIGYYMHQRDEGVMLRWDHLRIEGDYVLGKPVINMAHSRGSQTVDEIENGFLNAASVGDIVVVAYELQPDPAQEGAQMMVVTEWYNKECSLVDVPGNRNAFKLYDKEDKELHPADIIRGLTSPTPLLPKAISAALQLNDLADEPTALLAVQQLQASAAQAVTLQQEKNELHELLNALQEQTAKSQVQQLIDTALQQHKLSAQLAQQLTTDYANNPTGLQHLLENMPAYVSIVSRLQDTTNPALKPLLDKTWDELDKDNKLQQLKAEHPSLYALKYQQKYGKEPVM